MGAERQRQEHHALDATSRTTEHRRCKMKIYWYMSDHRFDPGTVADIGNIRLHIRATERKRDNRWKLYMSIRTRKRDGVKDDLKREVCVAEFERSLSLKEVQRKTEAYLQNFIEALVSETLFFR